MSAQNSHYVDDDDELLFYSKEKINNKKEKKSNVDLQGQKISHLSARDVNRTDKRNDQRSLWFINKYDLLIFVFADLKDTIRNQ